MSQVQDPDLAHYWAGLELLARLSEAGAALTSEEVSDVLGTRNVKGIGAALSGTRMSLEGAGIRFDEAVGRRTVRRRSLWTAGPRLRQARHVLERTRRYWTKGSCGEVPLEEPPDGYAGPVLVLRALRSRGKVYRFDGSLAELAASLDDALLEIPHDDMGSLGEIFVHRIEPGLGGVEHPVPEGYEENGIWVRGEHDYAWPRVAGALGTGRYPLLSAWIREACWAERRIALADAESQVEAVCARRSRFPANDRPGWRDVEDGTRIRYVEWVGAPDPDGRWSAPPLGVRLRCWYEIPIRAGRKPIVLREEGLRGDDARTAAQAIARWRASDPDRATVPVAVGDVRIAGKQPRPLPPGETG